LATLTTSQSFHAGDPVHSGRVQNEALTWQQSGVLCAGLLATAATLHVSGRPRVRVLIPYARETAIIAGLYALWQLAGTLSVLGTSGAFARARWIERVQHDVGLPAERSVQNAITGHPLLVQACNYYYATMHFGALFVFLLWLFLRHRDRYPRIRLTLALLTLVSLVIQLLPVAPPRLLPGYIDTAAQYGQSVYSLGLAPDQLSAMPSLHVGWAVLIAWSVVRVSDSPWRWLVVLHPACTAYVVAATANHFWLDGVVAVLVLGLCIVGQLTGRRAVDARRTRRQSSAAGRNEVDAEIAEAVA
jgi:hypothetical protein